MGPYAVPPASRAPALVVLDLDPAGLALADGPETLRARGEAEEPGAAPGAGAGCLAGPSLSDEEARALRALERAGVSLAVFTCQNRERMACELERLGLHPLVVPDVLPLAVPSALDRAARRCESLVRLCDERHLGFEKVCVIASQPMDAAMLFKAGIALALEGAGYRSCAAADAVFPARERGGLAMALADACEAASFGAAVTGL